MASIYKPFVHQIDVKTAFLNGELEEEIYMDQLNGCVTEDNEHKVCKLVKSLNGLKQAPKKWHEKFDKVLVSKSYLINEANKCIYSKQFDSKIYMIICLYVDDMLIFGTSMELVKMTKSFFASNCDMKDLGAVNVIVSIKIIKSDDVLVLSQEHYVEKFLRKFGFYENNLVSTLYDANT